MSDKAITGTITISMEEYVRLSRNEAELNALENGGVDNWEWHYDSLREQYVEPFPDEPGAREYD